MNDKKVILQFAQLFVLCISLLVIVACGEGGIINTAREYEALASDVEGIAAFPDPVTSAQTSVTIRYTLKNDVNSVGVKIYDIAGAIIKNLEGLPVAKSAIPYEAARWDLTDWRGVSVASGQYMYRFIYKKGENEYSQSGKIAVQR